MGVITAFLDFVPRWVWLAIIAALGATNCNLHHTNGQLEIAVSNAATKVAEAKKETSDLKMTYALDLKRQSEELTVATQLNRQKEQELQLTINLERKKTNEAITALTSDSDVVRVRLLTKWGFKPATSTRTTCANSTATGVAEVAPVGDIPQLPAAIGDLIDEAKRADTIRIELLGCYKAYDDAREKLSEVAQPVQLIAKGEPK